MNNTTTLLLTVMLTALLSACSISSNTNAPAVSEPSRRSESRMENESASVHDVVDPSTEEETAGLSVEFDAAAVKSSLQTETYFFVDDNDRKCVALKLTNPSEFSLHMEIQVRTFAGDGSAVKSFPIFVESLGAGQTLVTNGVIGRDFADDLTKVDIRVRESDDDVVSLGSDYSYTGTMETFESSKGVVYKNNLVIMNNGDIVAKNLYVGILYMKGDSVVDCSSINLRGDVIPGQSYEWSPTTRIEHDSIQVYFYGEAEIED